MLSTPDVVPLMLTALPTFQSRWQRHLAAWSGKKAGDYNDVGEFAQHLVDLYAGGETAQVRTGLDLVERLLIEGDDDVRQLAVVGILEDIQNIASHRTFGYKVFEEWLGQQSRQSWQWLEEIWKGKTHLAEVLAAEQGQKVRPRRWWKFWERRVPPPDIENIENPELRAIIEGLYRWAFDHDRAIALLSGVAAARRGSRRDGFFRDVPEGVR